MKQVCVLSGIEFDSEDQRRHRPLMAQPRPDVHPFLEGLFWRYGKMPLPGVDELFWRVVDKLRAEGGYSSVEEYREMFHKNMVLSLEVEFEVVGTFTDADREYPGQPLHEITVARGIIVSATPKGCQSTRLLLEGAREVGYKWTSQRDFVHESEVPYGIAMWRSGDIVARPE